MIDPTVWHVGADLEAAAYETGSNEEDGEASNHGGEASLEHARGHEGEQHS